ncbi:MAG: hypothetical protein EOM23_05680 [Candidatus Moranbacteria bacterium]|nr:hypothetical protein [Candidatus Moranbacteria bacterium]
MKYKVTTPRETYEIEAENVGDLRKDIVTREKISYQEVQEPTGRFIFLEQDDPKWRKTKIGNTPYELEDFGCLITVLSMFSYWYGKYFTPAQIAKMAKFISDGSYIWNSGNSFLPFKFKYRYYSRDIEKIKEILFSKDNACAVRVFYSKLKKSYHWIAVIGYDSKSGKLIGADPINGQSVVIEDKYGLINGFAEVTRA